MEWIVIGFEIAVGMVIAYFALMVLSALVIRVSESRYKGPLIGVTLAMVMTVVIWVVIAFSR